MRWKLQVLLAVTIFGPVPDCDRWYVLVREVVVTCIVELRGAYWLFGDLVQLARKPQDFWRTAKEKQEMRYIEHHMEVMAVNCEVHK